MTLYPNIIYHGDSDTVVFIDTLQGIGNPRNADMVEYTSAVDGKPYSFTRDPGQRALMLSGKISTDNENALRRQLDYLIGGQVYLMLGAEELATLAKIRSYNFSKAVGTYTPLTLDVVCDGSSEGQFHEAEDNTYSSTDATDALASIGMAAKATTQWTGSLVSVVQDVITLPEGNYTMFARVRDTNQVTDDVHITVYNGTESTGIASDEFTVTDSYAMYTVDFTITSSHSGDTIRFYVQKGTTTTNDVYIDFLGFVRRD